MPGAVYNEKKFLLLFVHCDVDSDSPLNVPPGVSVEKWPPS